ncbi:protein of unknown function (plasmid) [Cupriavidus taiwanensis]|uniref:Uncharacterized protein n=1 Tax=Cupriavidus taiwanensis TaxID=164546 RepID=A0A375IMU3_9BURK|nr:protein of unknown function [Cupriavidus taiwanensis]
MTRRALECATLHFDAEPMVQIRVVKLV